MTNTAFPYYGGKNRKALHESIISLFPLNYPDLHYCEPFFGSGAVFFNKAPSRYETINDMDRDAIAFFDTLRLQPDNLFRSLMLTPHARAEFDRANSPQLWLSDLEQARQFYIRVCQSYVGSPRIQSSGWRRCVNPDARTQTIRQSWAARVERLWALAERLISAQIENKDALLLIPEMDSEKALFYLDPPYVMETRSANKLSYTHEMDEPWHCQLAQMLLEVKGKVVLSGYRNGPYKRLEKSSNWIRIDIDGVVANSSPVRALRSESLWLNYEPPKQLVLPKTTRQLSLFGGES